jgi:hypothetical protein
MHRPDASWRVFEVFDLLDRCFLNMPSNASWRDQENLWLIFECVESQNFGIDAHVLREFAQAFLLLCIAGQT